jgi:DNA-binding response OmpR family regulator
LLVEDDENVRTVLSILLQNAAYEVTEAQDGAEALQILNKNTPDIIISDLMMPKLSGYGVVKHVRSIQKFKKLPILILTAAHSEDNELKLLDIGADDFVGKAADPKVLLSRVSSLLRRAESN